MDEQTEAQREMIAHAQVRNHVTQRSEQRPGQPAGGRVTVQAERGRVVFTCPTKRLRRMGNVTMLSVDPNDAAKMARAWAQGAAIASGQASSEDPGAEFLHGLDVMGRALAAGGFEGATVPEQVDAMGRELDTTRKGHAWALGCLQRHPCRKAADCLGAPKQEEHERSLCTACGGRLHMELFDPDEQAGGELKTRVAELEAQIARMRDEHRAEIKDLERDARAELRQVLAEAASERAAEFG